jgi:LuxR family maltose regulon positive regulatory protein
VQNEKIINIADAAQGSARDPEGEGGWLLLGKLAPPQQRVRAAKRVALLSRLDKAADAAVCVIVSPPGFGKTTLLTQWWQALQHNEQFVPCWLSLEEADAEPGRFMAGVILAVAKAGIDVGSLEIAARQQAVEMNLRQLLATFLNQVRHAQRRVVLFLDDYHRARSPATDAVIETLIDHGHPAIHLVISTRQRPTFHVSALAVRGLMATLDAADLAMSQAEAAELIGPGVSEEELALLHMRTEGWAVALQLARLWLDRGHRRAGGLREFSGRTAEMTEYLSEQIIQDLPADLREFLLETSILDRFDANLADAVRGRNDSAELIERLAHLDALLVRLDGPRESYRYHALFADFLTQRLHRGPAGRAATHHRRAARWLADAGDLLEGVKHAIKAGDEHLAVDLVQEAGGWELVLWRGVGYVRTLLRLFSDVTIRASLVLQLTQAYLDLKCGEYDSAWELLRLANTFLGSANARVRRDHLIVSSLGRGYTDDLSSPDLLHTYEAKLDELDVNDHLGRGTLLAVIVLQSLASGDLERTERESRAAIQQMRAAGSVLGANYFFLHLGQSQLLAGRLREAEALYRESLAMAEENFGAESGLKALSATYLAESLYLRGDLAASKDLIDASCETIETHDGWLDVYATSYELMVRQAQAAGDFDRILKALARSADTARRRRLKRLSLLTAAWRVEQLALAGHLKEARAEAKAAGLRPIVEQRGNPGFAWRVRAAATLALARLSIASAASAQALELLDVAIPDFRQAGLILSAQRLLALSIVALKQRGGSEAEAVARAERLLDFVLAEGASQLVLEQGRSFEGLLHAVQRRNRELVLSSAQRNLTAQLLAAIHASGAPNDHGFSTRELAVLREVCNGRSNKAIGQLLDLSENTVKFHLKRIFKKLEVESRSAVIAAAMQRGLIEISSTTKSSIR